MKISFHSGKLLGRITAFMTHKNFLGVIFLHKLNFHAYLVTYTIFGLMNSSVLNLHTKIVLCPSNTWLDIRLRNYILPQ
jgi:hypothetical protein